MSHTPAPWSLWHNEKGAFVVTINTPEGATICSRNDIDHRASESIANGRLIAASPDLLDALKGAVASIEFYAKRYNQRWDGSATAESILGAARAAIAKAEATS